MPRRPLLLLLLLGVLGSGLAAAEGSPPRILRIDAPDLRDEAYRTQAAALLAEEDARRERDVRVEVRLGARAFRLQLIGRDGGVKLEVSRPVAPEEIWARIDAMPMRQAERRGPAR
jgi:hypothetical protein